MAYERKYSLPDKLGLMIVWFMVVLLAPNAYGQMASDDDSNKKSKNIKFSKIQCFADFYLDRPLAVKSSNDLLFYSHQDATNSVFRYNTTTNATEKLFDLNRDAIAFFLQEIARLTHWATQ